MSGLGTNAGIAREKYWHEKTDAEKILLLGDAVENLTREVRELRNSRLEFRTHLHGSDQKVLIPLELSEKFEHESYFFRNPLKKEKS